MDTGASVKLGLPQLIPLHGLRVLGNFWVACHLVYAFLAFSAYSELLRHEFMTVNNWRIISIVLFSVFAAGSMGIFNRVMTDRHEYNTTPSHHHPFYTHMGIVILCKLFIMVGLILFYSDYEDQLPEFNSKRYSSVGVPVGLEAVYQQWQNFMAFILFSFVLTTFSLSLVVMRMKDPRVMDGDNYDKPSRLY